MKKLFDRQFLGLALALIGATAVAYWPVFQADFVVYDDLRYVTENASVRSGLTWAGVKWAFTTGEMGSWHPVTWLSHMADVEFFGLNPGAHHAVNLVLHLANVLLVLVLFRRLTGDLWSSAVAAGLFALHPIHVESVAWIAERKDVLSAFFGLLSLLAYTRYAQSALRPPPSGRFDFLRSPAYWLTGFFLAFGLMSKPMLVTWPFLMLLLDYWPLRRCELSTFKRLVLEKLPFLPIVGTVAVVTVFTQQGSESVISLQDVSLASRLANVLSSLLVYVSQFCWPTDLAPFYPFVQEIGTGRLLLAGVVVAGFSVVAFRQRLPRPWFGVGWCWYLISLLPVCGLVQVGFQAHADRYLYLPSLGLGMVLVWSVAGLVNTSRQKRRLAAVTWVLVLGIFGWRTQVQARFWQGTTPLFRHTLAVTQGNFMAYQALAEDLLHQGKMAEAKDYFLAALAINPKLSSARNNLAVLLLRDGKYAEAIAEFRQVLTERPSFSTARFNQAEASERLGQPAVALALYQEYLTQQPQDLEAQLAVARCLTLLGRLEAALAVLNSARQNNPTNVIVSAALAMQWQLVGNAGEAVAEYEHGLTLAPDAPELCNNFAWLLATHPDAVVRNGARAVQLAENACRLTDYRPPVLLGTLAAAYAEAGRFADAIKTGERARDLALAAGQADLAQRNEELLKQYRAQQPYHAPKPRAVGR